MDYLEDKYWENFVITFTVLGYNLDISILFIFYIYIICKFNLGSKFVILF